MNFWDENVFINISTNELVAVVEREMNDVTTEVLKYKLDEDSKHVAAEIVGYVARKLSECLKLLSGSVSCHYVSHQYGKPIAINSLTKVGSTK